MEHIVINKIKNILKEIENTEKLLEHLERDLNMTISEFKSCNSKKKTIEFANYLYWNVSVITAKNIAINFFDTTVHKLLKIITPVVTDITCKKCNAVLFRKSRSDHNYNQYKNKKEDYLCEECIEQRHIKRKNEQEQEIIKRKEHRKYLRSLPYSEYLKSDHWQSFRKRILKSANYTCSICHANESLHVHHRTYENLGDEYYKDVIVLCENCHKLFHKDKGVT